MVNISFKYRFILSFVVLEILFLTMIAFVNFNNINKSYENFISYKKDSLITLGKQLLSTPISVYDIATIDNIVTELVKLKGVSLMKVWDSEDNLLSQSSNDLEKKPDLIKLYSDIIVDDIKVGKFTIWIDLQFDKLTIDENKKQTIFIIILEILISTLLSWFIGHKIAESLVKLTKCAQNISTNLSLEVPLLSGAKEVQVLSKTLESMRKELLVDRYELEHYKRIIDKDVIISRTNLEGKITYVSKAFCTISGYDEMELMGKNHNIVRHPDMPNEFYTELWKTILDDQIWNGEIKNRRKDGSEYWVDTNIFPWYDHENNKIGYIGIRHDISDKKIIEKISITDGLTNIFNRRHFDEVFPKFINMAKRNNDVISFLILDIDHFKQYNDTYGHQKGDDVLIKVASTIEDSLKRSDDVCFRLGGEEFGVLFKTKTKNDAIKFANTIRTNLEDLHIEHSGNSASAYVTASMGLICKNANDMESNEHVYKNGDDLLYNAKESGRNKVVSNLDK